MFNLLEWTITQDQINHYARVSGDYNPIHIDLQAAQKAGLPNCIAHGMLVMALGSWALRQWGENAFELVSYEARFQAMTFPGEPLLVKGFWINKAEGKGSLTVENKLGEVKMKGAFTANIIT